MNIWQKLFGTKAEPGNTSGYGGAGPAGTSAAPALTVVSTKPVLSGDVGPSSKPSLYLFFLRQGDDPTAGIMRQAMHHYRKLYGPDVKVLGGLKIDVLPKALDTYVGMVVAETCAKNGLDWKATKPALSYSVDKSGAEELGTVHVAIGGALPRSAQPQGPFCDRCSAKLRAFHNQREGTQYEGTVCATCQQILCTQCYDPKPPYTCSCGGEVRPALAAEMGYAAPVSASRPVVDLRSGEERSIEQEAQRPLLGDDEQLSRRIAVLIKQGAEEYRTKQNDALARTSDEIKRIGEHLYANGGHEHMQKVYYRVQALGGQARLIDLYWDGIGEWEG